MKAFPARADEADVRRPPAGHVRVLSGGESQRINLATSRGANLTGSMYILDEPSIGLHSRDTEQLIHVLKQLQIYLPQDMRPVRSGQTIAVIFGFMAAADKTDG